MPKINVLVLPSDTSGVGRYRSVDPHIKLQNLYPEDFHVDIDYQPRLNDINYWKKYQIVHFHRSFGQIEQCPQLIKSLQSLGIIIIGDIDDYWLPTKEHPIHQLIVENKMHLRIVDVLKVCDYVTTTTEIFANEIRKFNKNVIVLPNAIDPTEPQFTQPTLPSDKVRVGWLGGSSHLHDLKLLDGMVNKLKPIQDKLQYYVCGFDIRGSVTEINRDTGERTQRPIKPEETVWVKYEEIFTDNYKIITPEYKIFLDKFVEEDYPSQNENYVRVWTRPVESYARNYSKI
jgi:glycosyltransferase involved in cell wall biosynthesis